MNLNAKWKILRPLVSVFLKIKFGYRYKKAYDLPDNYIVVSNHTTDYDPLFVGVSFPKHMRFVASGHIVRWGRLYKLIDSLVSPIIRQKGAPATGAIKEMMKTCKNGGSVAMFPEGVRSWDGSMSEILPSTAKLIKSLRCGLVTYRISGGYFTSPMWSEKGTRRGHIHGEPVNVYTKEQLKVMSDEEVYEAILKDISVDAYKDQETERHAYRGKRLAEHVENLLYICPKCGAYDSIVSKGKGVSCEQCNMHFTYDEYGMLDNIEFVTIKELSDWQKEQLAKDVAEGKAYELTQATLSIVETETEKVIGKGRVTMDREELYCDGHSFPLSKITHLAMHGKRAVVFTVEETYYELCPTGRENALKIFLYFKQYQKEKEKVDRKRLFSAKQFSIIKS